jgi:hypothetical protein
VQRDVTKFNVAMNNNLKYVVYYSEAESENFEKDLTLFKQLGEAFIYAK